MDNVVYQRQLLQGMLVAIHQPSTDYLGNTKKKMKLRIVSIRKDHGLQAAEKMQLMCDGTVRNQQGPTKGDLLDDAFCKHAITTQPHD